jgi:taurine dioxygenase
MRYDFLDPIGVVVTDLNLDDVTEATVSELQRLLADHGVAVLPRQSIDDTAFVAFLEQFGHLTFSQGEVPVDGFPDLNVISNMGRSTPPRSVFHVDTSYVRQPPAYTALRAVRIPTEGGETLISNQYRAFETLPSDIRERLRGRTIRHVISGVTAPEGSETEAEHPIFRYHPISGRIALYLSTPQRCVAISGMSDDEATETIEYLYLHSTSEHNVLRHSWSDHDLVIWDNGCVIHRADHTGVVGDRVMHRGMVADYRSPVAAHA